MKKIISSLSFVALASVFCSFGVTAENRVELLPANPWDSNDTHQVVWETKPGVRYELQESGSLTSWVPVDGYPTSAVQYADAHAFDMHGEYKKHFYRVLQYDEQPPAVNNSVPTDGAFAVPRFSSVSCSLSDASGVDTNSIAITVGDLGAFTLSDSQLTYTNGVLVFDNGSDTALSYYGTNIQVSLIATDVNGYVGTNNWSFDLELEADVTTNLFVFGSPEAQRAGQEIGNIPTRVLAERAVGGPVRMNGTGTWEIQSVETNRIFISYTDATAPLFNEGDYLANLTPASVDEIFYRQITGLSDDTANNLLTLVTRDARLTEMVAEGTASITDESMILEVSTNGTIVSARAVEKAWDFSVPLERIGYSLDGETFTAQNLSITAEECNFWLYPSLEVALEIKAWKVERFKAIVHADLEGALIINATASAGTAYNDTIYDLPRSLQPKKMVTLGTIGGLPIIAEVGMDIKLDVDMYADVDMDLYYGFRDGLEADFGVVYENDDFDWVKTLTLQEKMEEIEPWVSILGELGFGLTLYPSIYISMPTDCAGIESGPAVRMGSSIKPEGDGLAWYIEGNADWKLGLRGWAFEFFDPLPSFPPWTLWNEKWRMFPLGDALEFIQHPSDIVAKCGESATFSCNVSSDRTIRYQWYHNGTLLLGQTGRTLALYPLTYSHTGSYWVRVTSGEEVLESEFATLTVQ